MYILARIREYSDGSGSYIEVYDKPIINHADAMALAKEEKYDCIYIFSNLASSGGKFVENLGAPKESK